MYHKKKSGSLIYLVLLLGIISIITYYRIQIQLNIGPGWDTFDFLANAAYFAGQGYGYADLTRPPLLSFLTSPIFKLGYLNEGVIFYIDGLLFIFGTIGLYLLFRLRFNHLLSFLGSLLYATLPIVLLWVSIGYTDIASVSLSIWGIYLTILAVKTNSKFFYISFPFLILAFLARYPAELILLPILLYLIINLKNINLKDMVIGIFSSFMVIIPVLLFFNEKFNNPVFPFLGFFNTSTATASMEHFAYAPNPFYYLNNMASYISFDGVFHFETFFIIIMILVAGILIYIHNIMEIKKIKFKNIYNNLKSSSKNEKIKIAIFIGLALIFILTFNNISYTLSELLFLILCYSIYTLLKNIKHIDTDLLFLSLFMVYFIFHSVYTIKVDRYFITMAFPFIYFVILGLNEISNKFKLKMSNKNLTQIILSVIIMILVLTPSISWIEYNYSLLNTAEDHHYKEVRDSMATSQWMKSYEPDYRTKNIYSDFLWPHFSWYLKTNVKPIIISKNVSLEYQLNKSGVDYYLSSNFRLNSSTYKKINQFGDIVVYKRN